MGVSVRLTGPHGLGVQRATGAWSTEREYPAAHQFASSKCEKRLLAPVLFEGSTNAEWFNTWLEQHLLKELAPDSMLIMDKAAFPKTGKTRESIHQAGHTLLFLPPYSPAFNPIEQDFTTIKKRRQYASPDTPLDDLIRTHGTSLE